jgi:NADH pyrophosphatase NudC (nudix superfamily)
MTIDEQQAKMFLDEAARLKALAQEEHNFCPRCGKRLRGVLGNASIHTCTPVVQEIDIRQLGLDV